MKKDLHPVEELANIRRKMKALQAREAELQRYFVDEAAHHDLHGPSHRVVVQHHTCHILAKTLLPWDVLESRSQYTEHTIPVIEIIGHSGHRG